MGDLLATAISLGQLGAALPEHRRRLERLPAHVCRALVERVAEFASSLLLELDGLVLRRRCCVFESRLRLVDEPFCRRVLRRGRH